MKFWSKKNDKGKKIAPFWMLFRLVGFELFARISAIEVLVRESLCVSVW